MSHCSVLLAMCVCVWDILLSIMLHVMINPNFLVKLVSYQVHYGHAWWNVVAFTICLGHRKHIFLDNKSPGFVILIVFVLVANWIATNWWWEDGLIPFRLWCSLCVLYRIFSWFFTLLTWLAYYIELSIHNEKMSFLKSGKTFPMIYFQTVRGKTGMLFPLSSSAYFITSYSPAFIIAYRD